MNDLLGPAPDRHRAGGASRMRLLPGVTGNALFTGDRQQYRLWLERDGILGKELGGPYALVIGMNPSEAAGDVDDMTMRKGQGFVAREGLNRLFKCNVIPFCCTNPRLLVDSSDIDHPDNLPTILRLAKDAEIIILATGALPPGLHSYFRAVTSALLAGGHELLCYGLTDGGWPLHTSRLPYDTDLEDY